MTKVNAAKKKITATCLTTHAFKFVDVKNHLSPGLALDG